MIQLKGIFRYVTFGLRQEWISLFFNNGLEILKNSGLGPKQKQALYHFLKDAELIRDKTNTTQFFDKMKTLYSKGASSDSFWSFLWINISYNSPLFKWYNMLEPGEYTKKDIFNRLSDDYGKKSIAVGGVCTSLISTFAATPIGTDLKIGKVIKQGNARKIIKQGGYRFHPLVILYSLYKYAEHSKSREIPIHEIKDSPLSPQKIFVLDTEQIRQSILSLFEPDFITVDFDKEEILFSLNKDKTVSDVMDLYLMK